MNNYLILVNGRLVPPGIFDVRKANSAVDGQFVSLTAERGKIPVQEIKYIDVLEVRASNVVRRYHADKFDDVEGKFSCRGFGVDNTF